jgi:diacylglycerol kinase family enzyme
VRPLTLPKLLWHFPKVFLGTIDRAKQAVLSRTDCLRIESKDAMPVHVDGEIYTGDTRRMEIEVIPGALTVIGNFSKI